MADAQPMIDRATAKSWRRSQGPSRLTALAREIDACRLTARRRVDLLIARGMIDMPTGIGLASEGKRLTVFRKAETMK
jgi:hypothetical protein